MRARMVVSKVVAVHRTAKIPMQIGSHAPKKGGGGQGKE